MNEQKNIPKELLTGYNPADTETSIYSIWEESGYFNPDNLPGERSESFSIVLPPPNVTGTLHTGHAIMLAIQDTLTRFHRMNGKAALWLPGTDHAAIATQSVVEKKIQKEEGKSRHDIGRDELLKRIHEFAMESQDTILSQCKSMGASMDWSRLAFTMDDARNLAVRTMFKKMYDDGLIYQGHRIVNWDPKGQTTISDDELVYVEEKTKFYYFKYGPFTIGTARPETKFGDKYVVMHPDDARFREYSHGQKLTVEWINGPIEATIIKDTSVDPEFGTGVMTITPWHSVVDFEIAKKHNLDYEQIIDTYGKLLPIAGEEFAGMKIQVARNAIVEKLEKKGLVERVEDYMHNISTAERTGGTIEPQIMKQWFVAVNKEFSHFGQTTTLKKLMLSAVESGETQIVPERFEKIYFHWIENLRDWCISRQIWYGHRIPVWYDKNGTIASVGEAPSDAGEYTQDTDTLDTWFSSGMWTFSTLGWPNETADFKKFHPTTLLETGHDIIFFWVARMILFSTYALDEVPFKTVYLHGLVRDAQGRKMSKSLGNVLDPREISTKFGTDALRMALIVGNGPGNDLKLGEDRIKNHKNFANKIWNASRFVLERTADYTETNTALHTDDQAVFDAWLEIKKDITTDIEEYRLHLASEKIYNYFWHTFCDEIIETRKTRILENRDKESAQKLLITLLEEQLIVLHPFMPFITEKIWSLLGKDTLLMIEPWNR
jgi:valyl-tRNA synthetase